MKLLRISGLMLVIALLLLLSSCVMAKEPLLLGSTGKSTEPLLISAETVYGDSAQENGTFNWTNSENYAPDFIYFMIREYQEQNWGGEGAMPTPTWYQNRAYSDAPAMESPLQAQAEAQSRPPAMLGAVQEQALLGVYG